MNNVNIIGRICKDLELKKVGNDKTVLKFSVAVSDGFGDKEHASFFDVTAWNKQAENIAKFFKKGQRIGITGRLKQERWQDKEGKNASRVGIVLTAFSFIEKKDGEGQNTYSNPNGTVQSKPKGGGYDFPSFPADQNFDDEEVPF